MVKRVGLLFLTFLFGLSFLQAQDDYSFFILETDTSSFPDLRVIIQVGDGGENLTGSDFLVFDGEERKPIDNFDLAPEVLDESGAGIGQSRFVMILIEASTITAGRPLDNFLKAVGRSIPRFQDGDRLNIAYFGEDDYEILSRDFTSEFSILESELVTRIKAPSVNDSIASQSDVYKGMYKSLEYFEDQSIEGRGMLIVISSAVPNRNSTYGKNDIIEKAQRLNIPVYNILYRVNNDYNTDSFRDISEETKGETQLASSSYEIRSAITNDFLQNTLRDNMGDNPENTYAIEYTTEAPTDGKMHEFEIQFGEQSQIGTFVSPTESSGGGGFLGNYWWIILILAAVVAGYAFYQYTEQQKAKQEEEFEFEEEAAQRQEEEALMRAQEEKRLKEMEAQNLRLKEQMRNLENQVKSIPTTPPPPPPPKPQKFDPKKTIISGGGAAPIFMVATGSFRQDFTLNKPVLTIGRAPNNDITIPEQTVSSNHARITIENGSFFLTDIGSTNGTFVNGSRVNKTLLKSGDFIKLGAANCKFQI